MTQDKGIHAYTYFVRKYPKKTALVVLSLIAAAVAELLGIGMMLPLIAQLMGIEGATGSWEKYIDLLPFTPTFLNLLIVLVVAVVIKSIIMYCGLRYAGFVSAEITYDFRKHLIAALMNAKWPYYTSQPVGRIANALAEEAARAGNGYALGCKALASLVLIATYFLASLFISWKICLITLFIGGLLAISLKAVIQKAREAGYEITQSMQMLLNRMIAALDSVKPVKAMHLEQSFLGMIDKELQKSFQAQKNHVAAAQMVHNVYEPVAVAAIAIGLFGITQYTDITTASALMMAFLFYRLMGQFNLLQNHYQNMVQAESAVWSIVQAIKEAEICKEIFPPGNSATQLHDSIVFKETTFKHEGQEKNLFKDMSAKILANKLNVIFGPSGTGKTTLIDMILGFYIPEKGEILLDGKLLTTYNLEAWRKSVGYVPQDTYLFNESIKHNVTFGDENASEKEVWNALKSASASVFVEQLPEQLDYIVGEKGSRLSGGQKQRISIARALYRKPTLLIMDEATTGLDKQNETAIMDAIQSIKSGATVLMITHNQALLDRADNVITLG